jgi:hypothetical protein
MSDYDRRVILRPEHASSEEPELQWLEDSINGVVGMAFELLSRTVCAVLTAGVRLFHLMREKRS